jgi:hypothetical protein
VLRIAEEVRNLADALIEDSRSNRLRMYLILAVVGYAVCRKRPQAQRGT